MRNVEKSHFHHLRRKTFLSNVFCFLTGFGTEYASGKVIYEGFWVNGKRHGKGIQYNQNKTGFYYSGNFPNPKKFTRI